MNRKKLIITAVVLILILSIGAILAYFTDVQTKTNTFAMGKVKILVEEPSFPDNGIVEDIVPNKEIPKDPQITNQGTNDVYAFVEVTVPYANVKVGNSTTAEETELFTYTINSNWAEVGAEVKDTTTKTVKHVYAYVNDAGTELKALKGGNTENSEGVVTDGEKTPAVFNKVKFVDVNETDSDTSEIQGKELQVVVSGYGIQTTGLGTESKAPADIWALVK